VLLVHLLGYLFVDLLSDWNSEEQLYYNVTADKCGGYYSAIVVDWRPEEEVEQSKGKEESLVPTATPNLSFLAVGTGKQALTYIRHSALPQLHPLIL